MSEIFSCKFCNYTTKYIGNYNKHCTTQKHSEKVYNDSDSDEKKQENSAFKLQTPHFPPPPPPPPHLCGKCGKKYSRKDSLKRHQYLCFDKNKQKTLNTFHKNSAFNEVFHINLKHDEYNVFEKQGTRNQKVLEKMRSDSVQYKKKHKLLSLCGGEDFICDLCGKKYDSQKRFFRHKERCINKISKSNKTKTMPDSQNSSNLSNLSNSQNSPNVLEKYKNEINHQNDIIYSKELLLQHYEQELSYLRQIIEKERDKDNVNKDIGSHTHIVNKYENAPPLEKAKISDVLKLTNFIGKVKNKKEAELIIIKQIFSAYNHGTIGQYIGDIIISIYKKEDPELQSMWATDTSRLTYLIKKQQEDENSIWIVDKKGVETIKYVIDPIIEKIKTLSRMYLDNNPPIKYDESSNYDSEIIMTIEKTYVGLINDIDDKKIHQKVLKYISSHFYFDKSKNCK
jgi:hypothetical protein